MNHTTVSLPNIAIARLVAAVASITGVKFVGITYRSKGSGELARHTFIVGASYENVLRNSMEQLTAKLHTFTGIHEEAARNVIASLSKSLLHLQTETANPSYTQAGIWESICPGLRGEVLKRDENDKVIEWGNRLQIIGMSHAKTVLEAGVHERDTRRPLTKAQDEVKAGLPISKYRTLSVEADALESIRIAGNEIDVMNA